MARDEPHLRVLVGDARGRAVRAPGLARWLRGVAPARARGIVGIALVSDAEIRALNRTYRRKDYPTDVLSFGASFDSPPARARSGNPRRTTGHHLGDIVIARGMARRQAREAGHSEATELRVLALHGLLHLLGYDHERDNGRMRRVEERLRRKGGLQAGLIGRTTHPAPRTGTAHPAPRTSTPHPAPRTPHAHPAPRTPHRAPDRP